MAADPQLAGRARALVARMAAPGRPWLWKDPALCHFLGFWRPFWHEAVFLVMVRHPVNIAVSWNQFRAASSLPQTSLECNLLRWQHMMLSVLHTTDTESSVLFAGYEAMISDPPGQTRRLAGFLDRQCATASSDSTLAAMAAACEPALRRNRDGQRREEPMTPPQRALYRFLRQKMRQPRLPVTEDYPMPAGWRGLVTSEETPIKYHPQGPQVPGPIDLSSYEVTNVWLPRNPQNRAALRC